LGHNISLDEGNKLRKLLTKKGVDEVEKEKNKIKKKFIDGCEQKKIDYATSQQIWDLFEYFSGYGFNKSHAISYSMLSFQCAWLMNYYPIEWAAAFLDKEPEGRKERAINLAMKCGFELQPLDVNSSGKVWEIAPDNKTLIQPLTSIKGLGDVAIDQIMANRPFKNIEEFIFNENIIYSKLNKKALDALTRSGAMTSLIDERFDGAKHFWTAVAVDRPRKEKNLLENIEKYRSEGEFTDEERIQYLVDLTGVFPFDLVMDDHILRKLEEHKVPPLGEWDDRLGVAWFIPREVIQKKTRNGKNFLIIKTIDSTSTAETIKCWNANTSRDKIVLNHPYMAKLDYNDQWGFSTRSIRHTFRMLG